MADLDEAAIFNAARKIELPDERQAYLRQACGDDPDTFERVAAMLRVYESERDFLESPPAVLGARIDSAAMMEGLGTVIGRYKLLECIGEGGFAVVYMAAQTEPIQRNVALKIIKLGMDTRQVIARFEAERQALALMDHPGIAKVHDAGATETGRPYFVMQLIRGMPISEYCDRNCVTTEARLRLFLDVCRAVQHAHQKGIIHRDIKPTNVLVALHDGQPVPKVIDFGIAKAMRQRLTERTLFTSYRQIIGTPQYMSPEQAEFSDLDVDTRSDIYSLGVLLYELLTSTTPVRAAELKRMGYDEICRTILHSDPPTPSRRLSTLGDAAGVVASCRQIDPAGLGKLLRGDLDWIVMKALEKDRTRRYETADALALDIQRYLSHEAVRARPPSTAYYLRKFVRKYRRTVIAAGAMLALVLLALLVSVVGLFRLNEQRAIASRQRDRAEENLRLANELIQNVLAPASERLEFVSDGQHVQQVKADLLRQAIAYSDRVLEQLPTDSNAQIGVARLCIQLANLAFLAGGHEDASCRRAIAILDDLVAEFPDDATYRVLLAEAHKALAQLCWAELRWKESSIHYQAEFQLLETLVGQFPDDRTDDDPLVRIHGDLAYALQHHGELAGALEHYRCALSDRDDTGASTRQRYADLLMSLNRFADARQQLEEAMEIVGQTPPESDWDRALNAFWTSIILTEFGKHSICNGKPSEASEFLKRSVGIGQQLSSSLTHSPFGANILGWSYHHLSESLIQSGQFEEAKQATLQSLQAWQSAPGRMPLHNAALAYGRLGELSFVNGDLDEAHANFHEAKRLLERISHELPDEAYCQRRLILLLTHCPDQQFRDPPRAVKLAQRVRTDSNGCHWRCLALCKYRVGAWQEALKSLDKSMQLRGGGDAMDWLLLSMVQWQMDDRAGALQTYTRVQDAITAGQPIFYGEIGVLGFNRLLAEATTTLGLVAEHTPHASGRLAPEP